MSVFQRFQRIMASLMVVILMGCASQKIDWDYDTLRSLAEMKSYRWIEPALNGDASPKKMGYHFEALMDQRVHNAVDRTLQARGFQFIESDSEAVEFLVNYIASQKTRREERQVTTSFGYGFTSRGLGVSTDSRVQEYEEGSLIIDVIDPDTKNVIWRGRSRARIQEDLSPEQRTDKINQAVGKILEGFPRPKQ